MGTQDQQRWMALVDLLNSEEFDYPCTWFEDSKGVQSTLMVNRTVAAKYIPIDARRMKVPGKIWVGGDEWIHHDIESIYARLLDHPEYRMRIQNDVLYIELVAH